MIFFSTSQARNKCNTSFPSTLNWKINVVITLIIQGHRQGHKVIIQVKGQFQCQSLKNIIFKKLN